MGVVSDGTAKVKTVGTTSVINCPSLSISLPVDNILNPSTPHPEQKISGPSTKLSLVYLLPVFVPTVIIPTHIPPAPSIHVTSSPARA